MALDQKIYELRKDKLRQIEALGQSAYPYRYETTHTVPQVIEEFSAKTGPELESPRVNVSVVGAGHINVMVLGDTLIVTVGAAVGADAGVLTISAAAPLPAPPVPVQVSE